MECVGILITVAATDVAVLLMFEFDKAARSGTTLQEWLIEIGVDARSVIE